MQRKIIMAGFGGQGIMAMGQLLTYSGMIENKNVTWMPSYGPEMRGGSANCSVIISDDPVGAPNIAKATDVIVMNKPSYDKFLDYVEEGGNIFINSALVDVEVERDDINVYKIPATSIARDMGLDKVSNMVMLGAYLEATDIVKEESVLEAFTKVFGDKKKKLIPLNQQAMQNGRKAARGDNQNSKEDISQNSFNRTPQEFAAKNTSEEKIKLDLSDEVFEDDLKMVEFAIDNEKEGINFYNLMVEKYKNSEAAPIFKTLAEQEEEHVKYLKDLRDVLKGEKENIHDLQKPEENDLDWGDANAENNLALSTFSIGMQLEEDAVKFYTKGAEKTENEKVKRLFNELVYWEKFHYDQLKGQYDLYKERWWSDQSFSPM
ncbi:MAG: 2-oxoacid:acceptor oxidoreductase family protein [Tissierellia bacterium]|nr:2-oxoacid:acceptor oxidoreductase family protein [Tissierellia bacterium]